MQMEGSRHHEAPRQVAREQLWVLVPLLTRLKTVKLSVGQHLSWLQVEMLGPARMTEHRPKQLGQGSICRRLPLRLPDVASRHCSRERNQAKEIQSHRAAQAAVLLLHSHRGSCLCIRWPMDSSLQQCCCRTFSKRRVRSNPKVLLMERDTLRSCVLRQHVRFASFLSFYVHRQQFIMASLGRRSSVQRTVGPLVYYASSYRQALTKDLDGSTPM